MPLETSFNVSPYFDDYNPEKDFYKILFKPSVAVQARELNQLQSILQDQVERFGNHVFKSGTIISGVNFTYLPSYHYVKILDTQIDGIPALPSSYVNYYIKNVHNLTALIVNYEDGLESKSPELKTLYLKYLNSSDTDTSNNDSIYTRFVPNEQLTIYSNRNEIFKYNVSGGGSGFSNSDNLVVLSALKLPGNGYSFQTGERITQATTNAKAIIVSVNTTVIENSTVLNIRPLNSDLIASNTNAWQFSSGYNVVGNTSLATANVASVIGSGAKGIIRTDALGIVSAVTLTEGGSGYEVLPHVTINTANTTADLSTLNIIPQNYKGIVTVGNTSINSIGIGYAFAVTEGIIYQKGHFLKVDPQIIIIDKYSTSPDSVAVGFKTIETVVNAFSDSTLYDNAANTTNFSAPGADRLNLTPVLVKLTDAEASTNNDFFALAQWKDGKPFKENRTTVYNQWADFLATQISDTSGDYVIDPFSVVVREKSTTNTSYVQALIDPGTAYVQGYRVSTQLNSYIDIPRSISTTNVTNQTITLNYGNYIRVKEVAGVFNFKTGDIVSLRNIPKEYISSTVLDTSSITPPGSQIGTARIRSLVIDSGIPGTAECVYRMYLFDVAMELGYNFRQVKSIYFNGPVQDGVADLILERDGTTDQFVAVMKDANFDTMMFISGLRGAKTIEGINYTYRTVSDSSLQISGSGTLTIGPLGSGSVFPYDGVLSSTEKRDFIVVPISNTQATANLTGIFSVTSACTIVTGSGSAFTVEIQPGDFIKIANGSASMVGQVLSIANSTQLTLVSEASASVTTGNSNIFFPALYPIPMEARSDRSITINETKTTATIDIGKAVSTVNAIVTYNINRVNASPVQKSINRNVFVKIFTGNNESSNTGPWCLGFPGVARLKNVYKSNSATVNTNSTDVTKYFYIDVNDDENAYRLSKLVLNRGANVSISTSDYLLVKLDVFTTNGVEGFFDIDSYPIDDTKSLSESTTTINTVEIPETYSSKGLYYDHIDTFDFRPYAVATASLSTTVAGATVNPSSTFALSGDDQLFPAPDATLLFDGTFYNSRQDVIALNASGEFLSLQGIPKLREAVPPAVPIGSLLLSYISIPPYPSLPILVNSNTYEFLSKKIGNSKGIINVRQGIYTVKTVDAYSINATQPKRYTMRDIGVLEKRINDLEYAISLNNIEQAINNLNLPSGIAPNIQRFKNGYFVDLFFDSNQADTGHREYTAFIDSKSGTLRPPIRQLNLESQFDRDDPTTQQAIVSNNVLMLPYVEETLVEQTIVSSSIGSDGVKTIFIGSGSVQPPSFAIMARVESQTTSTTEPPSAVLYTPGVSPSGAQIYTLKSQTVNFTDLKNKSGGFSGW
jgi:hypothetical protein